MAREEYQVELTVTSRHSYIVMARSPEEAISNAEDLLHSGDQGGLDSVDVDYADAFPLRGLSEEEDDDDDSND